MSRNFDHSSFGQRLGRARLLSYRAKILFGFCFGSSHPFARKLASILNDIDKLRASLAQLAGSKDFYPLETISNDPLLNYFQTEAPSEITPQWAKTPSKKISDERWKRFNEWLQELKSLFDSISNAIEQSYGKNSDIKKMIIETNNNYEEFMKIWTTRSNNGVFQ